MLALGGIEPRKGSIELLEAWALLRSRGVALVFGGGETLFDYRPHRAEFDRRVAALGVEPMILGAVTEERLAPLVAGASALGLSVMEGFGLAAMEALPAGVPVVARELPVIREVFGDTVRYGSDPESFAVALEEALDGGGGSAAGRELAFSHSWDDVAAAHVRFYEELLGVGNSGWISPDRPGSAWTGSA